MATGDRSTIQYVPSGGIFLDSYWPSVAVRRDITCYRSYKNKGKELWKWIFKATEIYKQNQ